MKRARQPAATLQPGKYGTWTVVQPDGRAVHADSLDEAERLARRAGAIMIRIEGPSPGPGIWNGNA